MVDDHQYISDYLIHWAGRGKPDSERAKILSTIVTECRLLLSDNDFFFDGDLKIIEKMVCFTDVPLPLSSGHCTKYSNFGIAFHKLALMNKGAQPVFYFSHIYNRDIGTIFRYIFKELKNGTLDHDFFRALHRHFYFMKQFSEGKADETNTNYYEREWRIGEICLRPHGASKGRWSLHNALPTGVGEFVIEDDKTFFIFNKKDVAFLVVPENHIGKISNPYNFELKSFEQLVE